MDFGTTVKMITTLKTSVRAANNVEALLREKDLEIIEVGEKKMMDLQGPVRRVSFKIWFQNVWRLRRSKMVREV